jgi:hypothetical protein
MLGGPILALDLGRLTGVAEGAAGGIPRSLTWTLADPQDGLTVQCVELLRLLNKRLLQAPRPSLIVSEAPLGLAAFRALGTSEASIRSAYALAAIVAGIAGMFSIGSRESSVGQVTKHFTGTARHGGRESRKRAVILRCRALGYVPRDCLDEDRCDALAVWDFACAHYARRPSRIVLFDAA